ncbi:MAG TPA: oligosaccharide flippase family protein [Vicinamibacterales bacterium]|nr:oligosaccharide flippase family protein [Vicinamibacterales bacterium]
MIRGSSSTRNLLAGTITRYVLLAVNIGTGIFLMPFTVRHLGKAQYGLWMLVASTTYYFALLDLGYGNGIVRDLVEADAHGDTDRVNRIASTFFCVYSGIGLVACGVCAALILFAVPRFPNLSPADVRTAQAVLAIVGARMALGYPMTVFGAVTNSRQGFVLNNSIAIVLVALNAIVTYVVLTAGGGLIALVAWTTGLSAAGYGAYAWSAWRMFPQLDIRPSRFSRAEWRQVTTFSTYLFVVALGSQISFNVDNLVVGASLGTAAVAVYAVAARLSEYQRRVCDQFSGMLFPVVVGLGARGDAAGLRAALIDGARVSMLLAAGVTTSLVGFGRPLIERWMGAGFDGSVAPFYVLAAVGVIMVGHAAQSNVLLATGGHRIVAAIWIVEGVANLGLSLLLVRWFGSTGVALGTLIPMAVGHIGVMTPAACRLAGVSMREFATAALVPAIAGAVPAAIGCVLIRVWLPPASTLVVVIDGAVVGLLYLVAAGIAGLDRSTRQLYRDQVTAACRLVLQ